MAARKTDPERFPVRGTPSGYREIWDGEDSAVMEAQMAERERQLIAREVAASHHRGKGHDMSETAMRPPSSPAEDIATDP